MVSSLGVQKMHLYLRLTTACLQVKKHMAEARAKGMFLE